MSKNLTTSDWENTKVINENLIDKISELKESNENDITILGSGTILKRLTDANLIDEYQIMLDPVFIKMDNLF